MLGWLRRLFSPGDLDGLHESLQELEEKLNRLSGRLTACENSAAAANSRCERNETRLGKLEHLNGIEY